MKNKQRLRNKSQMTVVSFATLLLSSAFATADCLELVKQKLPGAEILHVNQESAGSFNAPDGTTHTDLPSFCRVNGVSRPTADSHIHWEVWMPASNWSGRFYQVGNGAFAGSIRYSALSWGMRGGNAVAATDNGHQAHPLDASWALRRPEKIKDYGYRSLDETTRSAKALINAYYGTAPKYSYFSGCSDGGREALVQVQRFPQSWDGVIVGGPFWIKQLIGSMWASKVMSDTPGGELPHSLLPLIEAAALKSCSPAAEVVNGIAGDPRHCRFDPATLVCREGQAQDCITEAQAQSLRKIYEGARNPRTGEVLHRGPVASLESQATNGEGWDVIVGSDPGRTLGTRFAEHFFKYMVFDDPQWTFRQFDFDSDVERTHNKVIAGESLQSVIDPIKTDLREFQNKGGKVIFYAGWGEPAATPGSVIQYYEDVSQHSGGMNRTQEFMRLFLVPGMLHCFGGPGPNAFGQRLPALREDAQHDIRHALQAWVEEGRAPEQIIGTKYVGDDPKKGVAFTRPLCPFPKVARYTGTGSKNQAESFRCVDGTPP